MGADGMGLIKLPSRHWRAAVIVGCTLLLALPLYQLRDHQAAGYYKQYIYDHLPTYLQGPGVYNNTLYHEGTEAAVHSQWNFSSPCHGFPNMDSVMLVMKTGATEAYDKLPTQLLTGLQCIDDFLIFSDLVSLRLSWSCTRPSQRPSHTLPPWQRHSPSSYPSSPSNEAARGRVPSSFQVPRLTPNAGAADW
jgi:hypothetical protein